MDYSQFVENFLFANFLMYKSNWDMKILISIMSIKQFTENSMYLTSVTSIFSGIWGKKLETWKKVKFLIRNICSLVPCFKINIFILNKCFTYTKITSNLPFELQKYKEQLSTSPENAKSVTKILKRSNNSRRRFRASFTHCLGIIHQT